MRERTFQTSAGLTINVADSETPGAPVVFLHGVTRRWQDWLGVVSHFTPHWRCLAPDARGHGLSDRAAGAYRVADYVPDFVELLRRDLREPTVVIGHSLGGNLAAAIAAEAPELVRSRARRPPVDHGWPATG